MRNIFNKSFDNSFSIMEKWFWFMWGFLAILSCIGIGFIVRAVIRVMQYFGI